MRTPAAHPQQPAFSFNACAAPSLILIRIGDKPGPMIVLGMPDRHNFVDSYVKVLVFVVSQVRTPPSTFITSPRRLAVPSHLTSILLPISFAKKFSILYHLLLLPVLTRQRPTALAQSSSRNVICTSGKTFVSPCCFFSNFSRSQ